MSYTYATFKTALATEMVVDEAEANFVTILPTLIRNAELRIYRDLDLVAQVTAGYFSLTEGERSFALSTGATAFLVVDQVNIITATARLTQLDDTRITQSGDTRIVQANDTGARTPLVPLSLDAITMMYPSSTGADTPAFFAIFNDQDIVVGPWPDEDYTMEVVGRSRPETLSSSNTTTFISTHLPDLFLAAAMVEAAAYEKNFSAMADNPQAAKSWDAHYKTLLSGAGLEEVRRKFQAQSWSAASPSPVASPPRS